MSFYSDASLVLIPSGYKDQKIYAAKPTDGLGDLVFSRASNATRVASNGLIEKVRTNEIRNSTMVGASAPSTLPTNWVLSAAGLTFTVIGTGTEDGFTYIEVNATGTASSSNARIGFDSATQILGATGQYWTNSFYFKKISETAAPDNYAMAIFENTSAGSLVVANVGSLPATTSFARYSYTVLTTGGATVARVQPFVRFSLTSGNSYNFTFRIAAPQMEQGDIATDYIATTTTAVSVGPVSGLPRLDYLNSSCPRLLLEPQRTNLAAYSEQFDSWAKSNVAISANTTVSPDGYQNADTFTPTVASAGSNIFLNCTTGAVVTTMSAYARVASGTKSFRFYRFNATDGVVSSPTFTATTTWQRFTWTTTPTVATSSWNISNAAADLVPFIIWGAQVEVGAYATSYIPTLSTSVTRVADAASKTGISSLIGQTEGTLFVDLNYEAVTGLSMFLSIRPNSTNKIEVYRDGQTIYGDIIGNSVAVLLSKSSSPAGRHKIALAYKSGQTALYVNGTSVGTSSTAFSFASSMADLFVNLRSGGTFVEQAFYNQTLLFKTRLSNDALASLTTL
jgi:hypothetical protein